MLRGESIADIDEVESGDGRNTLIDAADVDDISGGWPLLAVRGELTTDGFRELGPVRAAIELACGTA